MGNCILNYLWNSRVLIDCADELKSVFALTLGINLCSVDTLGKDRTMRMVVTNFFILAKKV